MAYPDPGHDPVTERRGSVAVVALLLAAPVAVGAGYGVLVAGNVVGDGWSIMHLASRLGDPVLLRNMAWSVAVAVIATTLATLSALIVAMHFRGSRPADRLARLLASAPLPIPPVVVATAGVLLLGQSGLLARVAAAFGVIDAPSAMLPLLYHPLGAGLILMVAWKEFGFLAMLACTLVAQIDPQLEDAARTLGASETAVRRRVVLPLVWRGLLPGIVAAFVFVLGSYELPLLLGPSRPQAIGVMMFERSRDADPAALGDAHAAALVALLVASLGVLLHHRLRARA
jgi:putative spermidine/putrescine transport system permease protein